MVTRRLRGREVHQVLETRSFNMPDVNTIAIVSSSALHTVTLNFVPASHISSTGGALARAYDWYLAGANDGLTLSTAAITGASGGTHGIAFGNSTLNYLHGKMIASSTGGMDLVLTSTGTSTMWLAVILGDQTLALSTAFLRSCG